MTNKLTNNVLQGLLIAAAVAAVLPVPELAWAADNDLAGSVTQVKSNITGVPDLIAAAFYVGGTLLIGAGLLKFKQHAENPGQTPLGQGLGRVVVGAGLLAIPSFGAWAVNTMMVAPTAQATYTTMNGIQ